MDKEAIARELLATGCVDPDNAALIRTAPENSAAFQFMHVSVSLAIHAVIAALDRPTAILALQSSERGEEREYGWLIEFPESGDSYRDGKRVGPAIERQYYTGGHKRTAEHEDAVRFSRRIDAERVLAEIEEDCLHRFGVTSRGFVCEHCWSTLSPAEPSPESISEAQGAICNIPNCRRACPAHEPFCSEHRQ
jgi:hypothetical protein